MKTRIVLIVLLFMHINFGFAQTSGREPDINSKLEMIENGQGEAVRAELPNLMSTYQNHPGLIYLQAVLTSDGAEAAKIYQSIVNNFPKNEWGDDALYKLYQYYYSIGLYKTANQKLLQLKNEYPYSAYASEKIMTEQPKEVIEKPIEIKKNVPVQKYSTSFTIQVGAFSTIQNANELKMRFEKEGYVCNIFTITNNATKLFKVWVGEYKTYDDAKNASIEIQQKFKLATMVVSR